MRRSLSLFTFSAIVSLLTLVLYNVPFFQFVISHAEMDALVKIFLIGTLVVVMLLLNFMLTYLLVYATRIVGRVILGLLSIVSATAVYFVATYSVMMTDSMIGNVFNTRYSEASAFFSWQLFAFIGVCGVLPALFILFQPVEYGSKKKMGIMCGGSLGASILLLLMNLNQTLWIGQYDTELGGLVMPYSYIVNTIRLYSARQDEKVEETLLPDGKITDDQKSVVVLVIGESARKANFELYGYERPTNPLLSQRTDLHIFPTRACATYTTAGCKAILEPKNSNELFEILPNYAFRTGVDVSWRTSNWGEPPVHIDEYLTFTELGEMYPEVNKSYDEILFTGIRERIEQSSKSKVLIILHTSTSHGPEYFSQYPSQFCNFTPVPDNVEESNNALDKLVNSYDNTIVYTDYLLNNLIDTLASITEWQSAMLYISDHGESLGENNMYMHGLPMLMAPATQTEIPFIVWLSSDYRKVKEMSASEEAEAGKLPSILEQHFIYHSVLNLLSIDSPVYNADYDIFCKE